jgi:REP element-mobilizing transposase RayT
MDKPVGHRRSIRLKNFDYSSPGAYFFTACVEDRRFRFGKVQHGLMVPNDLGSVVWSVWDNLPKLFGSLILDDFMVMPNHVHGILIIPSDAPAKSGGSLSATVQALKSKVIHDGALIRESCRGLWQRNYYEHVIRDAMELYRLRKYIRENPLQWHFDHENPDAERIINAEPWEEAFDEETRNYDNSPHRWADV